MRNVPPLSPTLKELIAENNRRVTEAIRNNRAKVSPATPPPQPDMATTSGLTDLKAEPNPTFNELFEKGSVEFLINGYIVRLSRGKATLPSTNCYYLSVNGFELDTPIVHYINSGNFMFSIPEYLRRLGAPGVIWDRNLCNAVNSVIADPWFNPWFERVVTTAEAVVTTAGLLSKGSVEYSIGDNIVHVKKKIDDEGEIIESNNFTIFSVSVNGVDLEQRLFYFSSGTPAKFVFQVPKSLDEHEEILVYDNNPYNALFRIVGKPEFSSYLEAVKAERAAALAAGEQLLRRILEEAQRFRAVLVRK